MATYLWRFHLTARDWSSGLIVARNLTSSTCVKWIGPK